MVVQVLVVKRDTEYALANQRGHVVHDASGHPSGGEAGLEPVDQLDRSVGLVQQQRAGIRGDRPTAKNLQPDRGSSRRAKYGGSSLHYSGIGGLA